MSKQLIIALGREYASGGHDIAEMLADKLNLELLDSNILRAIALKRGINEEQLQKYDELPKKRFLSRNVRGYSNSPEEVIANMQFEFLKEKAEAGDSFIVVGRCAESVLQDNKNMISIFVLADREVKINRVMTILKMQRQEAENLIHRRNKHRKEYHNYYCTGKWGDSRNYDLSINSSKLGISETADFLEKYINERTGK